MARQTDKDRVLVWEERIQAGSKIHDEWNEKYACDMTEQYYYGHQWQGETEEWAQRKYVINLFFPSINIDKPSMLFALPNYKVTPKPSRLDDPLSDVEVRAKLQEDTLNTFVQDPDLGFDVECSLGLLDAQFRFGVVEVGYTADFIDNPNAEKPMLHEDSEEPMTGRDGKPVMEPNVADFKEGLYLKWVPAKNCRVSAKAHNRISSCDWFAYFEWHHPEDLKRNKNYKNTANLKSTGRMKGSGSSNRNDDDERNAGLVKVWKLWDIRAKKRVVFVEGAEKFLMEKPYKVWPFPTLKFNEILGEWYPLPPTYNWIHPQNQFNEIREMRRIHRDRAKRRYGADPSVGSEEIDKLKENQDMTIITAKEGTIWAIPDAQLDSAVFKDADDAKEDFTMESGVSGEARQVAESETATQANLIAMQTKVRQSAKQLVVAVWLSAIGRTMLQVIRENMALPFWIKVAVDPHSPTAQAEAQEVEYLWKQITAEDLGDIDMDIAVDIASLSPVSQEQERTEWVNLLNVLANPAFQMLLALSPPLLRKTATMFGIKSEREVREIGKALQAVIEMNTGVSGQEPAGPGATPPPAPGPTPTNEDIAGQLSQQLPVEVMQ